MIKSNKEVLFYFMGHIFLANTTQILETAEEESEDFISLHSLPFIP